MTLTEFLLARLDEQVALACHVGELLPDGSDDPDADNGYAVSVRLNVWAQLVLADVEAKRAVIALAEESLHTTGGLEEEGDYEAALGHVDELRALTAVIQILAQPYRDHPDYDPAWA